MEAIEDRKRHLENAPERLREHRESLAKRRYSMVEVSYRNGQSETFPSDLRLQADEGKLWISDATGPLYVRPLSRIASISLKEVAA